MKKLYGYRRPDGQVGVRNHLLIIPASVCASHVASKIADAVNGAVAIPNQQGCCELGPDFDVTHRTLVGFGKNPNVGAVLVIGLGCEGISTSDVAKEIAESGKKVEYLVIQENEGTINTESKGVRIAREMASELGRMQKVEIDISEITLALECGGSDTTSGLASNPSLGYVSDKVVDGGGTVILSETTEFIGAEHLLAERAVTPEVADDIIRIVKRIEDKAKSIGVDLREGQPTPGNIQGGLTTIEEKSLGCIYKGGSRPIQGVREYGEIVDGKGLYIMDTPGQDIESITGMLAGGATVVIFSTGRGTPTGSPIAPVIKVIGNGDNYLRMKDNIDINAGAIMDGTETVAEVGERLYDEMLEVINGKYTKAESLNHKEFGIYKLSSTF
ncbi:MAG: UxaA family hydrolase [Tissierellaceae bacterium]|nr:UxaA family hydrolase [Tissierellaceae bacterium]